MTATLLKVYDLKTRTESKKSWKTYKGAERNCKLNTQIVVSDDGIDWMNRHPEWIEDRLATIEKLK